MNIRCLRPFLFAGQRVEIGALLDVPAAVAAEVITAAKACAVVDNVNGATVELPEKKPRAKKTLTTASAAGLVEAPLEIPAAASAEDTPA